MQKQKDVQEEMTGKMSCKILIAVQALLGLILVVFGYFCETNIYGPGYIDGFFSTMFLVPGLCMLVQLPFYLTYPRYESKVYLAPYSFLLSVAVANTLDCLVFGLFHFPTNWSRQIIRCIIISIIIGVINGAFAFVYVLLKGKTGRVLVAPNKVLVDGVEETTETLQKEDGEVE